MKESEALYQFNVGLLCSKNAECNCAAYDQLIFPKSDEHYMPPLHEGCDCYATRLTTIKEKLEED